MNTLRIALAAALLLAVTGTSAGAAGPALRSLGREGMRPSSSGGLITLPAEGGQAVSLVYRGWMDYYGVAVPGDSQLGPGGVPLDAGAQYLFAAVAAVAAQNDFIAQQSGWNDTVPKSPPLFNGSPVYGGSAETYLTTCPTPNQFNIALCGYGPTSGKQLETRNGITAGGNPTTPDSIYWGDGAPFTLASLMSFNNSNGMPDGYNLQRGPLVQVPLLVNGISIAYNPTNLTIPAGGVKLSRNSLCGIMQGLISNWNDPSITSDNGGSVIGNQPITVVHRSDGAGTTFILSYNLYVICSQANVSSSNAWLIGVGTLSLNSPQAPPYPSNTVVWPAGSIAANGASTQATDIANTAGGIGYLGTSFVGKAGGYEAYIQNTAGNFE
jgi:ABC-type phosphate transport system substrate-binding protein